MKGIIEFLWPALAAVLPGIWSYGHKKRMVWTALALLLLPVLVIIVGLVVLGKLGMTWRCVVWRDCGLCFVIGCAVLFVWAAVWLWREVGAGRWHPLAVWLCRGAGVAGIGMGCALFTLFAVLLVLLIADSDYTEEQDGQTVVAQYEYMHGTNYFAYYGPLVRGTELLPGSWELHVQAVEEENERVREKVSQALGLELSSRFTVLSSEETHGGFHNDGMTYIQLSFHLNIAPVFEEDPGWAPLPLPEELAALTRVSQNGPLIPAVENGYYWFQDRQAKDSWDYSGTLDRHSYNFTLAVYDADNKVLYYWVLDT